MLSPEAIQACLEETQAGHMDAFGRLVKASRWEICRFIAMLGVPGDSVEDVAQETFVAAWRGLASRHPNQPFPPWLRGIARNMARRYHTQQVDDARKRENSLPHLLIESEMESSSGSSSSEFFQYLQRCLEELPERMKTMICQKYYEGRRALEIARNLEISPELVWVTLGRARVALAQCVDSHLKQQEERDAR